MDARLSPRGEPRNCPAVPECPHTVGFVSVGESAIGRIVVAGEGPASAVSEAAPEARRQGLAAHIIDASRRWAAVRGADKIYLQTIRECTAAPHSMRRRDSATITNGAT